MVAVTFTVGTDSRDYATISLAAADIDGSTGAGDDLTIEIYNDSVYDENPVVTEGDGLNSITFTVPAADRHDGTAGTGARLVVTSDNESEPLVALRDISTLDIPLYVMEWFEVDVNGHDWRIGIRHYTQAETPAPAEMVTRNCIVHGISNANETAAVLGISMGSGSAEVSGHTFRALNNLVYDVFTGSAALAGGIRFGPRFTVTEQLLNNTMYDVTGSSGTFHAGFLTQVNLFNSGEFTMKNNIAMDCDRDYFQTSAPGTAVTATNNLCSDTSLSAFADSSNIESQSAASVFVSVTPGLEDFTLLQTAAAVNYGEDLGTTPANVEIDLAGVDRDSTGALWDMGAYELEVSRDLNASKRLTAVNVTLPFRCISMYPDNVTSRANRLADGYLYASDTTVVPAEIICIKDIIGVSPYASIVGKSPKAAPTGKSPYATALGEC